MAPLALSCDFRDLVSRIQHRLGPRWLAIREASVSGLPGSVLRFAVRKGHTLTLPNRGGVSLQSAQCSSLLGSTPSRKACGEEGSPMLPASLILRPIARRARDPNPNPKPPIDPRDQRMRPVQHATRESWDQRLRNHQQTPKYAEILTRNAENLEWGTLL